MTKFFANLPDTMTATFEILRRDVEMIIMHPALLIPMLIGWIFQAASVIYFKYYFNWSRFPLSTSLLIVFAAVTAFCMVVSVCCLILLEGIKQIDNKEESNLFKAVSDAFRKDLKKAFPIVALWAIILFIILVIEVIWLALTKREDEGSNSSSLISLKDISETLAGYNPNRSFSISYWLEYLRRGIRLVAFFTYSVIVFDKKCGANPIKRVFLLLKGNVTKFLSGFFLTEFFVIIICSPVSIVFCLSRKGIISLSDACHIALISYIGLATSVYLSLQQIFASRLYRDFVENEDKQKKKEETLQLARAKLKNYQQELRESKALAVLHQTVEDVLNHRKNSMK